MSQGRQNKYGISKYYTTVSILHLWVGCGFENVYTRPFLFSYLIIIKSTQFWCV